MFNNYSNVVICYGVSQILKCVLCIEVFLSLQMLYIKANNHGLQFDLHTKNLQVIFKNGYLLP